jgi:transcriptional regulator with XRE-family HTH domain
MELKAAQGRRTPPPSLGRMLRRARIRAGLSQGQLARTAGLTQGYVSLLEAGLRVPSLAVAEALAVPLRLTVRECHTLYGAAITDAGRSARASA